MESHTLSTDIVGENLSWVQRLQRGPAEGEADTIEEDKCDESIACSSCDMSICLGGNDIHRNVAKACKESAPEEKVSPTKFLYCEGSDECG